VILKLLSLLKFSTQTREGWEGALKILSTDINDFRSLKPALQSQQVQPQMQAGCLQSQQVPLLLPPPRHIHGQCRRLQRPMGHCLRINAILFVGFLAAVSSAQLHPHMDAIDAHTMPGIDVATHFALHGGEADKEQVGVPELDFVLDLFRLPVLKRLVCLENAMHDETLNRQTTTGLNGPILFIKRRLVTARRAKAVDERLTLVLRNLHNLVLYWPEDCKLGRALLTSAGAVMGEDVLRQALKYCFDGKAVAALVKRTADFTSLADWMIQTGRGRPLNPTEAERNGYISMLCANGAGATVVETFLMPADAEHSDHWPDRRMTTAEGSYWLKDSLVLAGLKEPEASGFSTHSLKATPLSWAAKSATFDLQERLILGHHLDEETKMVVTYARDAIAATREKVYCMLETVRRSIFDPDASRAEGIAMATGLSHLANHLLEKNEMELDLEERLCKEIERAGQCDTDVEDDGADIQPVRIPEESQSFARSDLLHVESAHCVVHWLSGIVHCMETSDSLLCGRRMSLKMKPVDFP